MNSIIRFAILACALLTACSGSIEGQPFDYVPDPGFTNKAQDPRGVSGPTQPTTDGYFGTIANSNDSTLNMSDAPPAGPTRSAQADTVDPYLLYKMAARKSYTVAELDAVKNFTDVVASCEPGDAPMFGTCSFTGADGFELTRGNSGELLTKTGYDCSFVPYTLSGPVFTIIAVVSCLPATQ